MQEEGKLNRLSFWCLTLLGLTPLLGAVELGFWQVLRLLVVVVGLAWLLWRQHRGERMPWDRLVVPLVYLFVLTQFVQGAENGWLLLLSLVLIGLAIVGTRRELLPLSRLDRWVLVVGLLAIATSLVTQLILGPASGQLRSERWWGSLYLLELLLVYLAVSRLGRGPQGKEHEFRLLAVSGGAILVAGITELWQIGAAVYHTGQARSEFAAGHFDLAAAHVAALQSQDQGLAFAPLGVEHTVEQLATTAKGLEDWMALGDIAAQEKLWYSAQQAYQQVFQQDPAYPAVYARLGLSLSCRGRIDSALAILYQGTSQETTTLEDRLALAVVLARTAAWSEANQVLDAAFEVRRLEEDLCPRVINGKISGDLDALLPSLILQYARKLSFFEVVQLLENRGWKVLHPAMKIGRTGVKTPVDIIVYSGGGRSFPQENILIGDEAVSPHRRGYNLAVVDPETGKLDTMINFDIWGKQSAAHDMADFLSRLPERHIVAASVNDEASIAMTVEARNELVRLGAGIKGPGQNWSHALIGVRGAHQGEGVEILGERALVVTGVLSANIPERVADDPAQLEAALRDAAAKAPAGIAVYLPSLAPEARLVAAQR